MGTRQVQTLVGEVQEILQDIGGIQYTIVDVANKINEGEIAVGMVRPDALSVEGDLALVAGTRQVLTASAPRATRLRSILFNRGLSGSEVDGDAIRLVEREALDAIGNWRSETGAAVYEYVYDEREPGSFDVYPGMASNNRVIRAVWEESPAEYSFNGQALDPANQTITIGDEYAPALVEWALYRLLSRQDDQTPGAIDGSPHFNRFLQMLGVSAQSDAAVSLKQRQQLK